MIARRALLARMGALLAAPGLGALAGPPGEAGSRPGSGRILFVAPGGRDGDGPGAGSREEPFATLPRAFARAGPGDTILMRGGVYGFAGRSSGWLLAGRSGAPGRPITVAAHPGESPVLDGRDMRPPTEPHQAWATPRSAGGFPLAVRDVSHLAIRGLTIRRGPMGGAIVEGVHHGLLVEACVFHENGWLNDEYGTGLAILGTGDGTIVRNCDSFGNGGWPGTTGGNADGFQIFVKGGAVGTVIAGCRAWRNADDGFDFFNVTSAAESARASPCLVTDNWAFENGFHRDGAMNASDQANGNGFKLGGRRPGASGTHGGHTVTRCLAWGNKMNGFDDNGHNGGGEPHRVFNNVSFNNARNTDPARGEAGFAFIFQFHERTVLRNNVAFATDGRNEVRILRAVQSHNVRNGAPWNRLDPPVVLDAGAFLSLDDGPARGPRAPDGSLPESGFLRPAPGGGLVGRGSAADLPPHLAAPGGAPDIGLPRSGP